jgi:hypothetical protein
LQAIEEAGGLIPALEKTSPQVALELIQQIIPRLLQVAPADPLAPKLLQLAWSQTERGVSAEMPLSIQRRYVQELNQREEVSAKVRALAHESFAGKLIELGEFSEAVSVLGAALELREEGYLEDVESRIDISFAIAVLNSKLGAVGPADVARKGAYQLVSELAAEKPDSAIESLRRFSNLATIYQRADWGVDALTHAATLAQNKLGVARDSLSAQLLLEAAEIYVVDGKPAVARSILRGYPNYLSSAQIDKNSLTVLSARKEVLLMLTDISEGRVLLPNRIPALVHTLLPQLKVAPHAFVSSMLLLADAAYKAEQIELSSKILGFIVERAELRGASILRVKKLQALHLMKSGSVNEAAERLTQLAAYSKPGSTDYLWIQLHRLECASLRGNTPHTDDIKDLLEGIDLRATQTAGPVGVLLRTKYYLLRGYAATQDEHNEAAEHFLMLAKDEAKSVRSSVAVGIQAGLHLCFSQLYLAIGDATNARREAENANVVLARSGAQGIPAPTRAYLGVLKVLMAVSENSRRKQDAELYFQYRLEAERVAKILGEKI